MPVAQRLTQTLPVPLTAPVPPKAQQRPAEPDQRDSSAEFRRTGQELPPSVYKSVVVAFAWILAVARMAFGYSTEAAWLATVAIIFGAIFFGIPMVLRRANRMRARAAKRNADNFMWSSVETATGRLPGWEAYLQIIIIPLSLAVAATILGLIWMSVR
jgi:hypothetical protein